MAGPPGARPRPSQAAGPGEPGYLFRLESEGGAVSKPFPAQVLPPRQLGPLHFRGQRGMGPRAPRRNPRRRQQGQAFRVSRALPAPQVPDMHSAHTWGAPARNLLADKTGPCSPPLKWGPGQARLETPGRAVTLQLQVGRLRAPKGGQALPSSDPRHLQDHQGHNPPCVTDVWPHRACPEPQSCPQSTGGPLGPRGAHAPNAGGQSPKWNFMNPRVPTPPTLRQSQHCWSSACCIGEAGPRQQVVHPQQEEGLPWWPRW